MKEETTRRKYLKIMFYGFLQVFLVSINVYQISHSMYVEAVFVGFLISLVWTFNVRSVSLGGWPERLTYAGSAAVGTIFGMMLPHLYN